MSEPTSPPPPAAAAAAAAAAASPTVATRPRQACDSCRFRKVRCDRGQPCRKCKSASLRCEYLRGVGKTGPRCGQGRRQVQLRQGLPRGESSLDVFCAVSVTPTPVANTNTKSTGTTSITTTPIESPDVVRLGSSSVGSHDDDHLGQRDRAGWTWAPAAETGSQSNVGHGAGAGNGAVLPHNDFDLSELDTTPFTARDQNQRYCRSLADAMAAHIRVFLKCLFPIMPIVDGRFVDDALRLHELPPSRYGAIAAICAATRVQLRMDNSKNGTGDGPDAGIPPKPLLTEVMLIDLAENALRQYSVIDDLGLDSVLSSFFLFATYGNLDNPRHAWFYLNQAISLAHSLEITSEAGYRDLEYAEQERRRRLFWVLFVTERTFALQHRRGIQLRDTVPKPQIIDSDCPIVMHDFVNHIQLFEQLPAALYSWQASQDESSQQLTLPPVVNQKLCGLRPDKSVIESQRLDTTLTQQWLRIAMWRLAFGQNPLPFSSRNALLPIDLPMDAAKVLMGALVNVGPTSKDCHGIGLEQKLFDIGVGLADAARISAWETSSALQVGPRELLSCIVQSLSSARGCPSHLLPNLLEHSGDLLQPCSAIPVVNLQWHLDQVVVGEHRHQQGSHAVVEELLDTEPCSQDWLGGDLSDFQDMHAPSMTSVCDGASNLRTDFGGGTGQVDLR